jgi:two-component system LytT family sensor kinase
MDNNNEVLYLAILALAGFCVWLYMQLKKERKQQEQLSKENAKLIADNALLEAEHLKFQLTPHTLNNIMSNLKSIASMLNSGMESLSETLEYILYKGKRHIVSVEEELGFIDKYLELNKLFTTEVDAIKLDKSKVNTQSKFYSSPCLPHLISAYFIENAFKHGNIHHPEFLRISVSLTDTQFELTVKNRIGNRKNNGKGGIGLANMKKRMELLSSGKYDIKTEEVNGEYFSKLTIVF